MSSLKRIRFKNAETRAWGKKKKEKLTNCFYEAPVTSVIQLKKTTHIHTLQIKELEII